MTYCLLLYVTIAVSQKEDYIWCMGNGDYRIHREGGPLEEHTGNTFIDFSHEPPLIYQDEESHNQYALANAQISTQDGEPLLFCNGLEVRTYLKDTLDGAGVIAYSQLWDDLVDYDEGIRLTFGTNTSQSIVFLPIPDTENQYFLFYNSFRTPFVDNQLFHSRIDMSFNNGAGKAIYKDSIVRPTLDAQLSFYLRPVRHANGRDWWILATDIFKQKIYRMLIDPNGIEFHGEQFFHDTTLGQCVYSPDGRYFAMADCNYLFSPNNPANIIKLFEVDRCTGELVEIYSMGLADCRSTTGAGFSPDSRYLYYTNIDEILQVDLQANPIGSVVHQVWEDEGQRDDIYSFDIPFEPVHMQLGPDNRMYVPAGGRGVINVINKPWLAGEESDFENFAIITPTPIFPATPNILNPRLGPVDGSSCDTLGIDNNPVSQFRYYQDDSLDYKEIGFVDLSYMEPTSWEWDFDDGNSSTERYPVHSYSEDGIYQVCLTVSNENSSSTSCDTLLLGVSSLDEGTKNRHITLFPNPVQDFTRVAIHDYLPQEAFIRFFDQQGRVVLSEHLGGVTTLVDLSNIHSGIYNYEVWDGQLKLSNGKIVKIE